MNSFKFLLKNATLANYVLLRHRVDDYLILMAKFVIMAVSFSPEDVSP